MSHPPRVAYRHSSESRLANAARRLYGPEWSRPVAEATGINLRTVQRVAAAINAGHRDPRADSILTELRQRLGDIVASMYDVRESLTFQLEVADHDDPLMIPNYLQSLAEQCSPTLPDDSMGSITLWKSDLYRVLQVGRAAEDAKNDLLRAAVTLSAGDALDVATRAQTDRAIEWHGNAGAATRIAGRWRLLRYPWCQFPYVGGQPPISPSDLVALPRPITVACQDHEAVAVLRAWADETPSRVLCGPIEAPAPDSLANILLYVVYVNSGSDPLEVALELEELCDCTAVAVALTLDEQAEFDSFYTDETEPDDDGRGAG